jgi:hypothetical protein
MAKTFNLLTQLSLNDADFKKGIAGVKQNVRDLVTGVEGASGNINEMRKALMSLKNVSFAGKSQAEIQAINAQIGSLTDGMNDLRAEQNAYGAELGGIVAQGVQGLNAIAQIVVGAASAFGLSREQAEKYQRAMVQLIGVSQALATIENMMQQNYLKTLGIKLKEYSLTLKDTITKWLNVAATKAQVAAENARQAVLVKSTVATKVAMVATAAWNKVLMANPIGLIVAAVAALVAGIYLLIRVFKKQSAEQERINDAEKENIRIKEEQAEIQKKYTDDFLKSISKQKTAIDIYSSIIKDESRSFEDRKKAVEEIIKLDPKRLEGLTLQNFETQKGVGIINDYIVALEGQAKAMAAQTTLQGIEEDRNRELLKQIELQEKATELNAKIEKEKANQKTISSTPKQLSEVASSSASLTQSKKAVKDYSSELELVNSQLVESSNNLSLYTKKAEDFKKIAADGILIDVGVNIDSAKSEKEIKTTVDTLVEKRNKLLKEVESSGGNYTLKQEIEFIVLSQQIDAAQIKIDTLENKWKSLKAANDITLKVGIDEKDLNLDLTEPEPIEFNYQSFGLVKLEEDLKRLQDLQSKSLTPELWQEYQKGIDATQLKISGFKGELEELSVGDKISAIGGIFGELGYAIGESTGAWLEFAGSMISLIPTLIAQIIALTAAKQGEAMASGIAASQKVPFPLNLVALATTVAGIVVAFTKIPKFATGGIVPGSSYSGDNVPIMVNSGEMILNKAQQANLFNMIGKGTSNYGNEVVFKIDGTQLVGVINNHTRKINSIR